MGEGQRERERERERENLFCFFNVLVLFIFFNVYLFLRGGREGQTEGDRGYEVGSVVTVERPVRDSNPRTGRL